MVQRIAPLHTFEKQRCPTASEQRYAAVGLASASLICGYNYVMMKNRPRLRGSVSIRFAWLALHERLNRWQFPAVATSLFGLLIVIQPWNLASGLQPVCWQPARACSGV